MTRSLIHVASATDAGKRLDVVLADRACYPSRSAAAHAIERGSVLVGGVSAPKKYVVKTGDAIVYELLDDASTELAGEPIDLDIRYEDEDLLVLSKQAGLVCHPSQDHDRGTLVNALIWHCGIDNLCNVQGEDDRLGIVHRLDRDTSGLMVAAKNDEAGYALMELIRIRAMDRRYLSLVHGVIAPDTGMIDAPIARAADERTRMAVRDVPSAREAVTTFRVLERFEPDRYDDGYTLIDCKLFTGRTHQIRVHMQYAKHPVVGDPIYRAGAPKDDRADLGLLRQFLHSFQLSFDHPMTQVPLSFSDQLPADLADALADLRERGSSVTDAGREVFASIAHAPVPRIDGSISLGMYE